MRVHKRVHKRNKNIFVIVFFGIVSILAVSTGLLIQSNRNISSSQAAGNDCKCTDPDVCYPDGCTRKPKTEDNKYDDGRYKRVCEQFLPNWPPSSGYQDQLCSVHQPDCCQDMVTYQDARLCCFMERWHCHPSYCDLLTGSDESCGKYWDVPRDDMNEYGCVKRQGDDIVPKYGVAPNIPGSQPTTPPQPTSTPTTKPTSTPTPRPQATATPRPANTATTIPSPTTSNTTQTPSITTTAQRSTATPQASVPTSQTQPPNQQQFPTIPPSQDNDTVLPQFELPKFQAPRIALRDIAKPENIEKVNEATDPPLTAVKDTFVAVKKYDEDLESFIERYVKSLYSALKNILR